MKQDFSGRPCDADHGSDIYYMQEELVDDLYNRGSSETLHHFEIIDITQTAPQTYTVQEENGQILLANVSQN